MCRNSSNTPIFVRCRFICHGLLKALVFSHPTATPSGNQSRKVLKKKRKNKKRKKGDMNNVCLSFVASQCTVTLDPIIMLPQ